MFQSIAVNMLEKDTCRSEALVMTINALLFFPQCPVAFQLDDVLQSCTILNTLYCVVNLENSAASYLHILELMKQTLPAGLTQARQSM